MARVRLWTIPGSWRSGGSSWTRNHAAQCVRTGGASRHYPGVRASQTQRGRAMRVRHETARATRSRLPRRRFLAGFGGVLVGLPYLESLAPRAAQAQASPVKRFGVFFACNGVNMDRWFPNGDY